MWQPELGRFMVQIIFLLFKFAHSLNKKLMILFDIVIKEEINLNLLYFSKIYILISISLFLKINDQLSIKLNLQYKDFSTSLKARSPKSYEIMRKNKKKQ